MTANIFDWDDDTIPPEGPQRDAWDLKGCRLTAEWERFWDRIDEHERDMRALHGERYRGVNRNDAARAFRSRLHKAYGATEPSRAWCLFDDERRERIGKPPRKVFRSGPNAQSREHLEHWSDGP